MAAKEIRFQESARSRIVAGVNLLANAVKVSLVPRDAMLFLSGRTGPR